MDICLIRHAEAVEREAGAELDDFDRPLTEAGRQQALKIAEALPNRGIVIERLFVSPKTVEANLSRVYSKLGIKSRAELGRVMAAPSQSDDQASATIS